MKMSRSELKAIVRECLVEILSEGLGSHVLDEASVRQPERKSRTSVAVKNRMGPDPSVMNAARLAAPKDPVLSNILEDTARTTYMRIGHTLQTGEAASDSVQQSVGTSLPLDAAGLAMAEHEPAEVFGEDAMAKWADLAFAGTRGGQSTS